MKLPAGATGFGSGKCPGRGSERAFLSACHAAARQTDGMVTIVQTASVTPNFDTVLLGYARMRVAVLRHRLLNLVAFIEVPAGCVGLPLAFIDCPRLARIIGEYGFQVLPAADLQEPLTAADLSDLTVSERREVSYWKPAVVGELLFNYWD